jgi:hypothetical protein
MRIQPCTEPSCERVQRHFPTIDDLVAFAALESTPPVASSFLKGENRWNVNASSCSRANKSPYIPMAYGGHKIAKEAEEMRVIPWQSLRMCSDGRES